MRSQNYKLYLLFVLCANVFSVQFENLRRYLVYENILIVKVRVMLLKLMEFQVKFNFVQLGKKYGLNKLLLWSYPNRD